MIEPISAACIAALTQICTSAMAMTTPAALGGALAGGIIGNRGDTWLCRLVSSSAERFTRNIRDPENHDLFKGMIAAHAKALHHYAKTLESQARTFEERTIAGKVATLFRKGISPDTTVGEALMSCVNPLVAGEGDSTLEARRQRLIGDAASRLAAWIEQGIGEALPEHFVAFLTEAAPNGRASWEAIFQLHLSETIKTDIRYERILLAQNTAEILGRTISLQEIAERMSDQLRDIADKLEGVETGVASAREEIAGTRDDIRSLHELLHQAISQGLPGMSSQEIDRLVDELVTLAGGEGVAPEEMLPWLKGWIPSARAALEEDLRAARTSEGLQKVTREWLDRYVAPALRRRSNPYKELAYFDLADGEHFYGRGEELTQAEAILADVLIGARRPAGLCISGISGTGKSSFLRAGVLSRVAKRGNCEVVVLRPEELPRDISVAAGVLGAIVDRTDLPIPAQVLSRCLATAGPQSAQLVCEAVARAVSEADRKLVLAFDQLEEVVDYWAGDGASHAGERRFWAPLFAILSGVADSGAGVTLYTLESHRSGLIGKCHDGAVFDQNEVARIQLIHPRRSVLREIIGRPFEASNHHLSPALVDALLNEVHALRRDDHDSSELAVLPLLSLKLAKLYELVDQRFAPVPADRLDRAKPERPGSGFINVTELAADGQAFDFAMGNEISQLASTAWLQATGDEAPDEKDLDFFLPFIGVADGETDLLQLRAVRPEAMPYGGPTLKAFRKARLLVESEGRYRLIHEAVLRSWGPARSWLEGRLELLRDETRMRSLAKQWSEAGRPAVSAPERRTVQIAGTLLSAHLTNWSAPRARLEPQDELLRDYCIAIFEHVDNASDIVDTTTNLAVAAMYGLADAVRLLVSLSPEAVSIASGRKRRTPLAYAAWAHPDVVAILLDAGADPHATDSMGFTPIASAIWGGDRESFRLLLAAVRDNPPVNPNGTLLHECAAAGQVDMCKDLLTDGLGDPTATNSIGCLPVHTAAVHGKTETFAVLAEVSDPFLPDAAGRTAWHLACEYGHLPIVEQLVALPTFAGHHADCTQNAFNGLHLAATNHRAELVRWLLRMPGLNRPLADEHVFAGRTPLMLAMNLGGGEAALQEGDILATVRALLSDPATDPNAVDRTGATALSLAASLPRVESELLEDERLELSDVAPGGPIEIAARRGLWKTLRRMLERISADRAPGEGADGAASPLQWVANSRSLPDDIAAFILAGWPPTPGLAADLLPSAIRAINETLAKGLLEYIDTLDQSHRETLWHAASRGLDPAFLSALARKIPDAWSGAYWGGWTVLHRICAAQGLRLLSLYHDIIAAEPSAWAALDLAGRRPADLLTPQHRASLGSQASSDYPWPATGSWDQGYVWEPAASAEREQILASLAAYPESTGKFTQNARIEWTHLPFYPASTHLVRVQEAGVLGDGEMIYALLNKDRLVRLRGRSLPIHDLNESGPISLEPATPELAVQYVRFFCYFVRGDDGPFLVLEDIGQCGFPPGLSEAEEALLAGFATAPFAVFDPEIERFCVISNVVYGNAVFACDFEIQTSGMIEMLRDAPLTPDLSSKPYAPIGPEG